MKENIKKFKSGIIFIIFIIISLTIYIKFRIIREILFVLTSSFILAYSLKPLQRIIVNKTKINKKFIAAILVITLLLIIGIFIFVLIPKAFKESAAIGGILDSVESFINNIIKKIPLEQSNTLQILSQQFTEKFNVFIKNTSVKIFDTIIDLGENIIALAVVPIVTYYFLAYSDMLCNRIAYLIPVGKRAIIKKIGKNIDKVLGKYILGQLILSIIVGFMTFIAMILLKVKFPLIVSIFNAILNIIPYFGAILGIIPAVLVAIMDAPIKAVWVIISFIIIQQIEGNIISPQITANSINMHPLTVIILLLIGDKLGGFLGMILIIPIAVIIKVIYEDLDYYLF